MLPSGHDGIADTLNPGLKSQSQFDKQFANQKLYTANDIVQAYDLGAVQSTYGKTSWTGTRHLGQSNDTFRVSCGAKNSAPSMGGCETWFGSNELHAEAVQMSKATGSM
jgi:hypothetical protein